MKLSESPEVAGPCDWCRRIANLTPHRDFEEGLAGPSYLVCMPCIVAELELLKEELAAYEAYMGDDDEED